MHWYVCQSQLGHLFRDGGSTKLFSYKMQLQSVHSDVILGKIILRIERKRKGFATQTDF